MYTMSINPLGKMNLRATILIPLLLLTIFPIVPFVNAQVTPTVMKLSPTLMSELSNAGDSVNVLIQTVSSDYSGVVKQINDLGGKVGDLFKYVNGLSATIPVSKIVELTRSSLVEKIYYDTPRQLETIRGSSLMANVLGNPAVLGNDFETMAFTDNMLTSMPTNYWDTIGMGARSIWPDTSFGKGSTVVVIDTGIYTRHFMFQPKVALGEILGGVDLSPDVGTAYEGWNMSTNHWHGSHVAGTIASQGIAVFAPTSRTYQYYLKALETYSGIPLPFAPSPPYPAGSKMLSLLGMAPDASLYLIKVFGHTGAGVPESTIIDGMEHALDLKLTQGVDVNVVSMSLGGPTVFDGRDMEDKLADTLTANNITLVAAAGNDGPATMTVSTPGSANTTITAGAAADPVHTKSFFDYRYRTLGIGSYLFTSTTPQIIDFSSRGPTSDGRPKPTLSATGVYVLSAYIATGTSGLAWASGTSMATPAISGATALLSAYSMMHSLGASPEDFRKALTAGAVSLPGYGMYDQGAGYLNATSALTALKADTSYGSVSTPLPQDGQLMDISNIPIVTQGTYTTTITSLAPGHKAEFIFQATALTNSIEVDVTNIALGADPLSANSLDLYIQSAKRTTGDYYVSDTYMLGNTIAYITDDTTTVTGTFYPGTTPTTVSHVIEPGYVKVAIVNDFESFDSASANVKIVVTKAKPPNPTLEFTGHIRQGEDIGFVKVPVPAGTTKAILELSWTHNWNTYPTSDIDLFVFVNGAYDFDGATINSPERVVISAPAGNLYWLIDGFTIYTGRESWDLTITFM